MIKKATAVPGCCCYVFFDFLQIISAFDHHLLSLLIYLFIFKYY